MTDFNFIPDYYSKVKLSHFSPSQCNLPNDVWLHNYIFRDKNWRSQRTMNPNVHAGNAAQEGVNYYIFNSHNDDDPIAAAKKHATKLFKKSKIYFHGDQLEQWEVCNELIPMCVENGLDALTEIEFFTQSSTTEEYCQFQIPGIEVKTEGKTDLLTKNYAIELKTKWKRRGAVKKDGTRSWNKVTLPKEPDWNYLCQCAFYHFATKKPVYLIYHTGFEKGSYKIFHKDNCEKMRPEFLKYCLEHFQMVQTVRQNLLEISSSPRELAKYIQPDFSSFYWNDLSDEEMEEARSLWIK